MENSIYSSDGSIYESELHHAMGIQSVKEGVSEAPVTALNEDSAVKQVVPPKQVSGLTDEQTSYVSHFAKSLLEPFGQLGKLIMGKSEDIPQDTLGILLAAIPGPGKAAQAEKWIGNQIVSEQKGMLAKVVEYLKGGKVEEARKMSADIIAEAERQHNAMLGGYTTKTYHGTSSGLKNVDVDYLKERNRIAEAYELGNINTSEYRERMHRLENNLSLPISGHFYSSTDPALANMYSGADAIVAREIERKEFRPISDDWGVGYPGSSVVPLLLNTKDYHEIDAGGKVWASIIDKYVNAIEKATEENRGGVIVRNVWDEPTGDSQHLSTAKDVYITLKGNTARSANAKFDPKKFNLNDLLASGIATAVPAGAALHATKDKE